MSRESRDTETKSSKSTVRLPPQGHAYYFEYEPSTIHALSAPDHQGVLIGSARLDHAALAFMQSGEEVTALVVKPESERGWDTGKSMRVAWSLAVYGRLFDIQREDLPAEHDCVVVTVPATGNQYCATIRKVAPPDTAFFPKRSYLDTMRTFVAEVDAPAYYKGFLASLPVQGNENALPQRKFLVAPTSPLRHGAKGVPIVRVWEGLKRGLPAKGLCRVIYGSRVCIGQIQHDAGELQILYGGNVCQLDQSIREALKLEGQRELRRPPYEAAVTILPAARTLRFGILKVRSWHILHPRMLVLSLHEPSVLDSEQRICVLHENNIRLLGIEEGQYVRLHAVSSVADTQIRAATRRVFSGTGTKDSTKSENEYPDPSQIYLDAETREELGIPHDLRIGYPVLVHANRFRLATDRLLFYAVTFFVAIFGLYPIFSDLTNKNNVAATLITFVIGIIAMAFITWVDIRGKIGY